MTYLTITRIRFFFILLIIMSVGCSDESSEPTQDELIADQLQTIIDSKVGADFEGLVGVSVSIRVDGEERWSLVGGLSKVDQAVTSDMKFGVGSITKTAIAATILKLEEEGLLNIDDPLNDYIDFANPNVSPSITIFQLLSHFSGVEDFLRHPDLWPTVESDLDSPLPTDQLVSYIGDPTNEPGIEHEYSNSNYLLLALIIEEVTGQTAGAAMRERFWDPLQLNNIFFGAHDDFIEPLAGAWRDGDGDGTLEDITAEYRDAYNSVFYGPAGMFSSASDLSMWAYHLYGGNALSEASRTKMMTSYVNIPHPTFVGYGLGTRKNIYVGRNTFGHTGGVRGYGAAMFYEPSQKVSIAMLNNQSRSEDGPQLRHELVEELLAVVFRSL